MVIFSCLHLSDETDAIVKKATIHDRDPGRLDAVSILKKAYVITKIEYTFSPAILNYTYENANTAMIFSSIYI